MTAVLAPRRLVAVVVLSGALLVAAPTAALAHGDARLADGATLQLAPDASVRFTDGLHYHRLVGTVRADGPVTVELVRLATGEVAARFGPVRELAVNQLVRCCPDAAWAEHALVVANPGPAPVRVAVRARLVHDDLAVMVDGAESGTRVSIVVLGLAWAALLWRAVRRRPHHVPLRRAVVRLALTAGGMVVLATWGGWRYGAWGAPGLLAGLADLPVLPFNPVVSRATLLLAVGIVLWGRAGTAWARVPEPRTPAWWGTGLALVGSVVAVAWSVGLAYGRAGAAVAATVAAAGPLLLVPALRQRSDPVVVAT